MTVYVMFENKKPDRIVNIDKEKYEIKSMHVDSCYDFIYLLYGFRKINTNRLYTHNSYNMLKKKYIYSLHFYHFNQNP
jgi:hypothetical protein